MKKEKQPGERTKHTSLDFGYFHRIGVFFLHHDKKKAVTYKQYWRFAVPWHEQRNTVYTTDIL